MNTESLPDILLAGYERFRETTWPENKARYAALAKDGQTPAALVIACADSRAAPEQIFDALPGEIFVVRNVANLVPLYEPDEARHGTSAALEFAVEVLGVPRIVVLGHSGCGGVRALMNPALGENTDFIGNWMRIAEPARLRACERVGPNPDPVELCNVGERENIRVALANLMSFPWIARRVAEGRLRLSGYHFDIPTGLLSEVAPL